MGGESRGSVQRGVCAFVCVCAGGETKERERERERKREREREKERKGSEEATENQRMTYPSLVLKLFKITSGLCPVGLPAWRSSLRGTYELTRNWSREQDEVGSEKVR